MSRELLTETVVQRAPARNTGETESLQTKETAQDRILSLQRTLGNRRAAELIRTKRISHEGRIIPLQPRLTVGAVDDPLEKEADQTAQHVMSIPESAAHASDHEHKPEEEKDKVTRSVQRSAAPSDGQSFEVGEHFESSLNASKGQGSQLPDRVRAFMEPRFGSDFSHVRVHTGDAAADLNRAVGAQAFAHGSEIFYGSAHGPADLELTAHELTHVVQQTGAPARKPQPPALNSRQTTDDVARQTLPQLQRYKEATSVNGMGSGSGNSTITFGPIWGAVTALNDAGPATSGSAYLGMNGVQTVYLQEDVVAGDVEMHIFTGAKINNLVFDDNTFIDWDGTVPYFISGEQLTFGEAIPKSNTGGSGANFSVSVTKTSKPSAGGYVSFTVLVSASGGVTGGGGIGIGPISASAPVSTTSNFAGGASRTFVVNLAMVTPKPITGPDVSFDPGKDTLVNGQEAQIASWFEMQTEGVKAQIRNGKRNINVSGYASTTGGNKSNRDLSEARAKKVERILRGHAGTAANINVFFFGEDNTPPPDQKEDPQFRRATIVVLTPSRNAPATPGPAAK